MIIDKYLKLNGLTRIPDEIYFVIKMKKKA